jgi:small-conductance mechanosensitive channel
MQQFLDSVSRYLGLSASTLDKVLWTIVVAATLILLRRLLLLLLTRRVEDLERRYIAVKTVNYLLGFGTFLALFRIWLGGVSGLAASIGIISAGLAIALHAPVTNFAGWVFLTVRQSRSANTPAM